MNLSYGSICALLVKMGVQMSWADEQYPKTLFEVMGEYSKIGKKPERRKVGSADMGKFIAKE